MSTRIPRPLIRAAFIFYAAALFVATHWPGAQTPGPPGSDLLVHAVVFATWTSLLMACGFFGAPLARRNILASVVSAAAFSALDEITQAIPWVQRHATIKDYYFNVIGIACAGIAALVLSRMVAPRPRTVAA